MSFDTIVSIICLVGAVGCFVGYKVIRKKHLSDPEFVANEKRREEEYLRKIREAQELEGYSDDVYGEYEDA